MGEYPAGVMAWLLFMNDLCPGGGGALKGRRREGKSRKEDGEKRCARVWLERGVKRGTGEGRRWLPTGWGCLGLRLRHTVCLCLVWCLLKNSAGWGEGRLCQDLPPQRAWLSPECFLPRRLVPSIPLQPPDGIPRAQSFLSRFLRRRVLEHLEKVEALEGTSPSLRRCSELWTSRSELCRCHGDHMGTPLVL